MSAPEPTPSMSKPAAPPAAAPPPAPMAPMAPQPAPAAPAPPNTGAALGVVGLGAALLGVFALPVEDFGRLGHDSSFTDFRQIAATAGGRAADVFFDGYAQLWWRFGLLAAVVVAVALLALTALRRSTVAGWLLAVVSVIVAALHLGAYAQTRTYLVTVTIDPNGPSVYDKASPGIWIAVAGFALAAIGGVVAAVSGRTRRAAPSPLPQAPVARSA